MKNLLILFYSLLTLTCLSQNSRLDTLIGADTQFLPMDTCTCNVYKFVDERSNNYTTFCITKKQEQNGYSTYVFGNIWQLIVRNDSIFRSDVAGEKTPQEILVLLYWPTKSIDTRKIIYGGDAVAGTQISEPIGYYRIENKVYANCYKFTSRTEFSSEIIIAYGIGIISIKDSEGFRVLYSTEVNKNCR